MNVESVKQQLADRYPGAHIKENTNAHGEVTEIVGEIDRTIVGSERDIAIVVADSSTEHFHEVTTEEYKVIKGSLRVFLNRQPADLQEGESITIQPGVHHRVEGKETWFYCYSEPDWTPEDFFLVESKPS